MKTFDRREFLRSVSVAGAGLGLIPFLGVSARSVGNPVDENSCWLDVCAPFIVEDSELGINSEIVLTSDTFVGAKGYEDKADSSEYEIFLYNLDGSPVGDAGVVKRTAVGAMQTTVIPVRDMLPPDKSNFVGGMRIRLRPRSRTPMHASDLFSSAFVRWKTRNSFDNVHANPDPLQWQRRDSFFYSMPFPRLDEYECVFSLFNPYGENSIGAVTLYDQLGGILKVIPYSLGPHASLLLDLRKGELVDDIRDKFGVTAQHNGVKKDNIKLTRDGGTIAVTNVQGSVKNFGYLLIRREGRSRFSIDHPIHQPPYKLVPAAAPFDETGKFKAKNILYTPLVFNAKKIGGVTIESRFHFSSGAPVEEHLWISPFITDKDGSVAWQPSGEAKFPSAIPSQQIERGVLKLAAKQSCIFETSEIGLAKDFSGGLSIAIAPPTNHTLMKAEIRVPEWGAHAFTHFRPGLVAARAYQKPSQRGGLMTDYITSGAKLDRRGSKIFRDEIVCVMNIDDKGIGGQPELEIFASNGLVTKVKLGDVPAFATRHYLLSELVYGKFEPNDLSIRLVDPRATMVMSLVHLDYVRRDIALDHGSDRFSTFQEFTCNAPA